VLTIPTGIAIGTIGRIFNVLSSRSSFPSSETPDENAPLIRYDDASHKVLSD
jgi:hypothetical protein